MFPKDVSLESKWDLWSTRPCKQWQNTVCLTRPGGLSHLGEGWEGKMATVWHANRKTGRYYNNNSKGNRMAMSSNYYRCFGLDSANIQSKINQEKYLYQGDKREEAAVLIYFFVNQ